MIDPNTSGLEQQPPEFDPALYEDEADEPTGIKEALEAIERKFGLPKRKPEFTPAEFRSLIAAQAFGLVLHTGERK